mmetsp:Transcript_105779/g.330850  ORF Transcript_105779/g.330850 Transcript_105779/m.330850 type:complete len:358 (+) Transcript_105779:1-1074(+)
MAATISAPWNYVVIQFFLGAVGATFVTSQFWCSLMFAANVVGGANAAAAGWGNLGGGAAQVFMVMALFEPLKGAGKDPDSAWRSALVVPAALCAVAAICLQRLCWDTPVRRQFSAFDMGKQQEASCFDYVAVLRDFRVVVMIFQYGACFGTELAMNNRLATHFRTYFQMKAADAATLASAFGLMSLFARPLGGLASDLLYASTGLRGRIWAHFVSLALAGVFLFAFGCIDNSQPWYVALIVLTCLSIFVKMSAGTSYGIVPFMNQPQLAVVSALVGAGGNLGAVIAGFCFYKPLDDDLLPFKIHGAYVLLWALLSPCYYWPEHGGMFSRPRQAVEELAPEGGPKAPDAAAVEPEAAI